MDIVKILAIGFSFAVGVMPLAYCAIHEATVDAHAKIECAKAGGDWRFGTCRHFNQ